jgi:hypothetical protein
MSTPDAESRGANRPTPDELAGIPVCLEEDDPMVLVLEPRDVNCGPRAGLRLPAAAPLPPAGYRPTADDLAGIPVSAEGAEDLTVRPWKRRQP